MCTGWGYTPIHLQTHWKQHRWGLTHSLTPQNAHLSPAQGLLAPAYTWENASQSQVDYRHRSAAYASGSNRMAVCECFHPAVRSKHPASQTLPAD